MADLIAHPQPLIILISALFLLLIPLAFIFVAFFSASITTKRIVQSVATVMLALATVGVGFLWMLLVVLGAFQAGHHENFVSPMVVYYSPWFIIGLWIVNLIVFLRDTNISIHDAAAKGNIEAVKKHLSAGTKVDAVMGFDGRTPLLGAVRKGHKEIAELLIAKGADVNGKDDGGMTPLAVAIHFKHPETADLLRKHGAKTAKELKAAGK